MFQGDSGGPLVACGPDGNCGTTAGMNYDLIGGLSSSSPSSSSSSSLFMSLYHEQESVLDSQIANIKLVTQVLCPLELAVPRLTSQASTQGCRLPDDEGLYLLCTMFNTKDFCNHLSQWYVDLDYLTPGWLRPGNGSTTTPLAGIQDPAPEFEPWPSSHWLNFGN